MSKSWAWLLLCLSSIACAQSIPVPAKLVHRARWRQSRVGQAGLQRKPQKRSAIDNGLPLGIVPSTADSESMARIPPPDDQPIFLPEGVIEAQSPTGELFGSDRTRAISTLTAEQIAAAAQAHGQEDDITVLTLTFAPAEVLHA